MKQGGACLVADLDTGKADLDTGKTVPFKAERGIADEADLARYRHVTRSRPEVSRRPASDSPAAVGGVRVQPVQFRRDRRGTETPARPLTLFNICWPRRNYDSPYLREFQTTAAEGAGENMEVRRGIAFTSSAGVGTGRDDGES